MNRVAANRQTARQVAGAGLKPALTRIPGRHGSQAHHATARRHKPSATMYLSHPPVNDIRGTSIAKLYEPRSAENAVGVRLMPGAAYPGPPDAADRAS